MYTPASATNHRLPYYSTRLSTLTLLSSIHCNYLSVCGLVTILRVITSLCVKGKGYVQPRPHESIDQRSSFWKSLLGLRRISCICTAWRSHHLFHTTREGVHTPGKASFCDQQHCPIELQDATELQGFILVLLADWRN